jgi:hypothetical protein
MNVNVRNNLYFEMKVRIQHYFYSPVIAINASTGSDLTYVLFMYFTLGIGSEPEVVLLLLMFLENKS